MHLRHQAHMQSRCLHTHLDAPTHLHAYTFNHASERTPARTLQGVTAVEAIRAALRLNRELQARLELIRAAAARGQDLSADLRRRLIELGERQRAAEQASRSAFAVGMAGGVRGVAVAGVEGPAGASRAAGITTQEGIGQLQQQQQQQPPLALGSLGRMLPVQPPHPLNHNQQAEGAEASDASASQAMAGRQAQQAQQPPQVQLLLHGAMAHTGVSRFWTVGHRSPPPYPDAADVGAVMRYLPYSFGRTAWAEREQKELRAAVLQLAQVILCRGVGGGGG
jgi:hypothetical protein